MRFIASRHRQGPAMGSLIALLYFVGDNHATAFQSMVITPQNRCRPISPSSLATDSRHTTSSHETNMFSPISSAAIIHRKRHRRRQHSNRISMSATEGGDFSGEQENNHEAKMPMSQYDDNFKSTSGETKSTASTAKIGTPNTADITNVNGDPSAIMVSSSAAAVQQEKILPTDQLFLFLVSIGLATAFAGVVSVSGPGAWRYYVAGGICASVSHAITTPIDVIKTKQQVDPELEGRGIVKSTVKIVKRDGLSALLAGLGPTTFGYLVEGSIKFGIYEVLKPAIRRFLSWSAAVTAIGGLDSKVLGLTLCGAIAGVAASLMLCPMEALRIRLVAEPDFAPGGWVDGGLRMLKEEGVQGLWNGMTSMMCKQVPYTITKNVSFDYFTSVAYKALKTGGYALTAQMKFYVPLVAAMLTSVFSCVSSQPGDMLLSVVSAHEKKQRTRDFAREILKRDGLKGFFVGMKARFLHVGIIVTIQLLIYDFVKRLCGIAATGVGGH